MTLQENDLININVKVSSKIEDLIYNQTRSQFNDQVIRQAWYHSWHQDFKQIGLKVWHQVYLNILNQLDKTSKK